MSLSWDDHCSLGLNFHTNFDIPHVRSNQQVEEPVKVAQRLGTEDQIGDLNSSDIGEINLAKTDHTGIKVDI